MGWGLALLLQCPGRECFQIRKRGRVSLVQSLGLSLSEINVRIIGDSPLNGCVIVHLGSLPASLSPAPLGRTQQPGVKPRVLGQLSHWGRASLSSGLNGPVCKVRMILVVPLGPMRLNQRGDHAHLPCVSGTCCHPPPHPTSSSFF